MPPIDYFTALTMSDVITSALVLQDSDVAQIFQIVSDNPEPEPPKEHLVLVSEELDKIFDPDLMPSIYVF
jgi:hypothetical protein